MNLAASGCRHAPHQAAAADKPDDVYARRIAYLIGEDGTILEAHPKVDPATYPQTQLATI